MFRVVTPGRQVGGLFTFRRAVIPPSAFEMCLALRLE